MGWGQRHRPRDVEPIPLVADAAFLTRINGTGAPRRDVVNLDRVPEGVYDYDCRRRRCPMRASGLTFVEMEALVRLHEAKHKGER